MDFGLTKDTFKHRIAEEGAWRIGSKFALVASLWTSWFLYTTNQEKLYGAIVALTFAGIETCFKYYTHKPEEKTSVRQFFMVMVIFPFFSMGLRNSCSVGIRNVDSLIRIAIYPFFIWFLEIFMGYAFIFLFGYNVAWDYTDKDWLEVPQIIDAEAPPRGQNRSTWKNAYRTGKDAYFHGNIKLTYIHYWWLLGVAYELSHPEGVLVEAITTLM